MRLSPCLNNCASPSIRTPTEQPLSGKERQWDDDGDTYIVVQPANASEIDATITVRESRPTALLPAPAKRCPSCDGAVDAKGVCPTCSADFMQNKPKNSGTTKPVIVKDQELFADDQPKEAAE